MNLTDAPTEIEIAAALAFLPKGGAIPGVDKVHDVLRRLAFERDRLRKEVAMLQFAINERNKQDEEGPIL
jgi:hypothetical protein